MKQVTLRKPLSLIFVFLVLNACSGVSVKDPLPDKEVVYEERAVILGTMVEWSLVGRISLDDGDRGGSGKLQWQVKAGNSELDFHGAMGRGAWHLQIGPEAAILKEANGIEQIAPGVDSLIQDRMGWPIPVEALQWWVRGLAAPGDSAQKELDPNGLLISLDQFGWKVNFGRYDSTTGISLPKRLNATRDNYRVKLAVSRWQMAASTNNYDAVH